MSFGVANRPVACRATRLSITGSSSPLLLSALESSGPDKIGPGHTQFDRTPYLPKSIATDRVSWRMAALEVALRGCLAAKPGNSIPKRYLLHSPTALVAHHWKNCSKQTTWSADIDCEIPLPVGLSSLHHGARRPLNSGIIDEHIEPSEPLYALPALISSPAPSSGDVDG